MNSKIIKTLLVLYVGFLSILIRGYSFGLGDQVIHLPLIFRAQDSNLYLKDYLFYAQQDKLSFFYFVIAKLITITNNTHITIFAVYSLSILLLFVTISRLAKTIYPKGLVWFLSPLLFIFPYHIGGSAIMSVESSLTPRTIGNVLSIFILYLILNKKYIYSFFILGLEFLLHPLSALYAGIILYSQLFFVEKKHKIKRLISGTLIFLIFWVFLSTNLLTQLKAFPSQISVSQWLSILKLRNPYAFPAFWKARGWLSLILGILPLVTYLTIYIRIKKKLSFPIKTLLNVLAVSFGIILLQIFFTSVYPLTDIVKLQLGRIWFLTIVLSFIVLSLLVDKLREFLRIKEKIFIIVVLIILTLAGVFNIPNFIRTQEGKWQEAQVWANEHTSKECVFLVPFTSEGFRVFSQRSTVGEYKDGTLSFYSSFFASQWKQRLDDVSNWDEIDNVALEKLQKKYQFSFLVSDTFSSDSLDLVFTNSKYEVYAMPALFNNCSLIY